MLTLPCVRCQRPPSGGPDVWVVPDKHCGQVEWTEWRQDQEAASSSKGRDYRKRPNPEERRARTEARAVCFLAANRLFVGSLIKQITARRAWATFGHAENGKRRAAPAWKKQMTGFEIGWNPAGDGNLTRKMCLQKEATGEQSRRFVIPVRRLQLNMWFRRRWSCLSVFEIQFAFICFKNSLWKHINIAKHNTEQGGFSKIGCYGRLFFFCCWLNCESILIQWKIHLGIFFP